MCNDPFLTVFTRCCQRPKLLARNIRSVQAQSKPELIEQLFVVDNAQRGLKWANRRFHVLRHMPRGEYVFHLDDDGCLEDPGFVEGVRRLARANDSPDVILVKVRQGQQYSNRILPPPHIWELNWEAGQRPETWVGSGYNIVTKSELWRANTHAYYEGQGSHWHTGGDWFFVTRLLSLNTSVMRLNCVAAAGRRRKAKEFEDVNGDWFAHLARSHQMQRVGNDVWKANYDAHPTG